MNESKHVARALENRQKMLDYIVKHGVATYGQLCALTKLAERSIKKHIDLMRYEGLICLVKHPHLDEKGRQRPSVVARPGFKPDFGPAPVRQADAPRASDFNGVRIVNADGSERVTTGSAKRSSEKTNARVFHAMPGSVAQIMAATKLCKASVNRACLYLVTDERAHVGGHEFIASNGHYQAIYFAGPGVSVPNPIKRVGRAAAIAVKPIGVRRDPLHVALFGEFGRGTP